MFYKTSGNLARVIPEYYDFIFATIKQPLLPFATSPPSGDGICFIVSDNAKVNVFFFVWLLSVFPFTFFDSLQTKNILQLSAKGSLRLGPSSGCSKTQTQSILLAFFSGVIPD